MVGEPGHRSVARQTSSTPARLFLGHLLLLCQLRQACVQHSALVSRQDVGQNITQTGVGPAPAVVVAHETRRRVIVGGPDEDARVPAGVEALCGLAGADDEVWEGEGCLLLSLLLLLHLSKACLPTVAQVPVRTAISIVKSAQCHKILRYIVSVVHSIIL